MAGNRIIYLNGSFVSEQKARISPFDRGLLLADGLFETMKAYCGKVFKLADHWQRLQHGADLLKIQVTISQQTLQDISQQLLAKNHLLNQQAILRLTITRGVGPRGLLPPQKISTSVLLTTFPCPEQNDGVSVLVTSHFPKNEFSPLAQIKTLNYLENILAKIEAVTKGFSDALLVNSKNYLIQASAANLFIVDSKQQLLTPPISDGVLPGITRRTVLDLAKQLSLPCFEKSLLLTDLAAAKEVFLTNSIVEIQPVMQVNNQYPLDINNNPITRKLQSGYQNHTLNLKSAD
ncbi:MAG: aminotransferase class IV [Proteobacteria bacterium]|nr:aminotransferase class IV [Pseudomonadota bacterium]